DGRRDGTVTDVRVDLYEEIAANDHRLGLRVIDVRRDDGATPCNLLPNEFRGNLARNIGAEGFAGMLLTKIVPVIAVAVGCGLSRIAAVNDRGYRRRIRLAKIFANRDELHLGSNDSLTRVIQLRDGMTGRCAQRFSRCRFWRTSVVAAGGGSI